MTLAPSSDFGIRGVEGKRYDVNEICAAPGCNQRAVHGHHLWPRSYLRGQPYEWVQLSDGTVIGNKVGLCVEHHNDVTGMVGGHKAWIMFKAGAFWWMDRAPDTPDVWGLVGPLQCQPPGAAAAATQEAPSGPENDNEEVCEKCGKPKHTKPRKPLPARKTKEWTLTVPDDAELGTDVLDGWADDLAVILGFSDETSRLRRYHAVVTGLAWVIQHRHEFVAELQEASRV